MESNKYTLNYLKALMREPRFSREDLLSAMKNCGLDISGANFKAKLQKLLVNGKIARVGRNAYYVPQAGVSEYSYECSERGRNIVGCIEERHPYLKFTIFELVQFNEFVNHQLAHNTIFVYVDGDAADFVFDTLKGCYPGKVLLNPTIREYHKYWYDDMIVINRLISEAPKNRKIKWQSRIEKILVDLMADNLLQGIMSPAELPAIYEGVFQQYIVDESSLFRYAKRRSAEKKIRQFIAKKTNVTLRLG